jgi:hypothetical protein
MEAPARRAAGPSVVKDTSFEFVIGFDVVAGASLGDLQDAWNEAPRTGVAHDR